MYIVFICSYELSNEQMNSLYIADLIILSFFHYYVSNSFLYFIYIYIIYILILTLGRINNISLKVGFVKYYFKKYLSCFIFITVLYSGNEKGK